jgi:hypothetical protein
LRRQGTKELVSGTISQFLQRDILVNITGLSMLAPEISAGGLQIEQSIGKEENPITAEIDGPILVLTVSLPKQR